MKRYSQTDNTSLFSLLKARGNLKEMRRDVFEIKDNTSSKLAFVDCLDSLKQQDVLYHIDEFNLYLPLVWTTFDDLDKMREAIEFYNNPNQGFIFTCEKKEASIPRFKRSISGYEEYYYYDDDDDAEQKKCNDPYGNMFGSPALVVTFRPRDYKEFFKQKSEFKTPHDFLKKHSVHYPDNTIMGTHMSYVAVELRYMVHSMLAIRQLMCADLSKTQMITKKLMDEHGLELHNAFCIANVLIYAKYGSSHFSYPHTIFNHCYETIEQRIDAYILQDGLFHSNTYAKGSFPKGQKELAEAMFKKRNTLFNNGDRLVKAANGYHNLKWSPQDVFDDLTKGTKKGQTKLMLNDVHDVIAFNSKFYKNL